MQNPLLGKWRGNFGGVPPFEEVKVEHFKPALLAAMDENRKEIASITQNAEAPTFENTVARFEDSGRSYDDVATIYYIWSGVMADAEFQAVESEMAPIMSAYSDEITGNEELFSRLEAVYESGEALTPEQKRLVWKRYTSFVRAGAKLQGKAKARLSEINQRLATLYTVFGQNVLADEERHAVVLETEADRAGLPEPVTRVPNTRSAVEPFLTYSSRDDLREKVWQLFVDRGKDSNMGVIAEILKLRAERAKLLGYATHAHWRLEDSMAKTPERAMHLLESVWGPAVSRVHEEVRDMLALAPGKTEIKPWDYRYFAEKVRKAKYDLDQNEIKPYLQLEKLRLAMFWVAEQLLGFTFREVTGLPVYHPDVQVFEVKRKGEHVGLWYFDPYARPGKRSGAWMSVWRPQERFRRPITTIVSNTANFVKGTELISWDDATTLFHEFGHALHGLSSRVTYPSLSGTQVARDYVEFPSQLFEHWLATPEVLERFALHHRTGAPMPRELREKIKRSQTFNQGFATVEYLSAALMDMKLHLAGDRDLDPAAFERDTLASLGMPKEIVMRHRTPQFAHVFSGDGYSAGYYSYLWADTLTADAFEAFTEAGGPFDVKVAERLSEHVFEKGDTVDPAEGYRAFRGRDPDVGALMRKRGFSPRS